MSESEALIVIAQCFGVYTVGFMVGLLVKTIKQIGDKI